MAFLFAISYLMPFPGTGRCGRSSSRLSEQLADSSIKDGLCTFGCCNLTYLRSHSLDGATCTTASATGSCQMVTPCSSLHTFALNCLAVRGTTSFFTPHRRRSFSTVLVALMLLLGGIEQNPGPAAGYSGDIQFGSINICSAVHRSALVLATIADHKPQQIDLLAL